eukprot:1795193-Karenia_brevis.AAC.1
MIVWGFQGHQCQLLRLALLKCADQLIHQPAYIFTSKVVALSPVRCQLVFDASAYALAKFLRVFFAGFGPSTH